jgi:3-phenylpropionate/cinnamic acid dioxygenase small subunit
MSALEHRQVSLADVQTHQEVTTFLALEAELIDSRAFAQWVELVDEDFTYKVPVPVTPDNPAAPAYDSDSFVLHETRQTLIDHWFSRYEPEMWEIAWAENPPVRFRHFVSNVRVRHTDAPDVLDVRSNAIVSAARQSSPTTTLHVERFDTIARVEDGYRLRARLAVPDETLLDFAQLRAVL